MKKFTLSHVWLGSLRAIRCSCEIPFMRINIFIWFPHEQLSEAIKSLKSIYFCLEVWWRQSSHEPHRWNLSECDFIGAHSPLVKGRSLHVRGFSISTAYVFVVNTVFTGFWGGRNLKMIQEARSPDNMGQLPGTVNPNPQLPGCIHVCSPSAVGHKLRQSSTHLLFLCTQLQSLFPRWPQFLDTFTPRRREKGIWRKRESGFLFPSKGCVARPLPRVTQKIVL